MAAWVAVLALMACNGPISDWPSNESTDDGPHGGAPSDGGGANPGTFDAGAGDHEEDASAELDAGSGSSADAATGNARDAATCVGHDADAGVLPDASAVDAAVDALVPDASAGDALVPDANAADAQLDDAAAADSGADALFPPCL